jgi:hypothetical protein
MSQTPCKRYASRFRYAGPAPAAISLNPMCLDRASIRFKHLPKGPLHPTDLPYQQTNSSNPVSVTPIIELGARIKSS